MKQNEKKRKEKKRKEKRKNGPIQGAGRAEGKQGHVSLTWKICMLGWWIVHTTVRPVRTVFFTAFITMAAARASSPAAIATAYPTSMSIMVTVAGNLT